MPRIDPDALRSFAARDWGAPGRLARVERAAATVEQRVRISIELYEAARRTRPDWPDDETRRRDLLMHQRMRTLLDQAPNVGAR